MSGDDTRFLTGTDEYSVNIATTAASREQSPKAFVDEMVGLFREAEDALGISPDRFIRTTDPDHVPAVHEMIRRAHANGDIYLGTYEGWYCPNEGFRNTSDLVEDASGFHCPNHPDVTLQWLTERNWFFRLSAYQERLERAFADDPGLGAARVPPQRDARVHPPGPRGLLDQPRGRVLGHPVPAPARRLIGPASRRHLGPGRRHRLRLVRRAHQLHHGRRLPRATRPRSTTGGRPTSRSSARTSTGSTRSTGPRCS